MDDPKADILSYSDSDSDALFDTPAARKPAAKPHDHGPNTSKPPPKGSQYTTSEDREAALRAELESVRNVNKVIEGVVASLQKAKSNMSTVSQTVHNATTLLQTWTRILSQTEHNQRLILSPQWQGATQDLLDIQEEESQRQHAAERRAAEDLARKEAAARKAEEDRRRAETAAAKPAARGRGRGSVRGRGGSVSGTSYVGVGGQAGRGGVERRGSTRGGSGIGRGVRGSARGRGVS